MSGEEIVPQNASFGRQIVDPSKLAEYRAIDKRDANEILKQKAPEIMAILAEETSENLLSENPDVRREAKAMAIQLFPYMLQKRGIAVEKKVGSGGGITEELVSRLSAVVGRDLSNGTSG